MRFTEGLAHLLAAFIHKELAAPGKNKSLMLTRRKL
jgi:hypothetical protein